MSPVHIEEFPGLALGKHDARPDAVALKLTDYLPKALPTPPITFGHYGMVPSFPMFSNDSWGCCVWSGAGHESQIFEAEGKRVATFTDTQILAAYTAVTGFNPADPSTDQGTDMAAAAAWRRTVGLADTAGNHHKIAAYTATAVGDDAQVETAAWLFGAIGIGWQLPRSAMIQFNTGKPWTVTRANAQILGGHYVPIVGADADWLYGITWGKVIPIDRKFLRKYMDEGIAYVSTEILWGGKSLEGFNAIQLLNDLRGIPDITVARPTPTQVAGIRSTAAGRTPAAPRARGRV